MGRKYINYKKFAQNKAGILYVRMNGRRLDAALKVIKHFRHEWDYVAWIAPTSYLDIVAYVDCVRKGAGRLITKFRFFSYEYLSLKGDVYLSLYNLANSQRVFCVIDESLNVKNTSSIRTQLLMTIRSKFAFRLLLSQDPISRGLRDIYAHLMFMDGNSIKMNENQFLHSYMPYYRDDFKVWKRWSKPKFERQAFRLLQPYILLCDFSDNLILDYHICPIELSEAEKQAYNEAKAEFLKGRVQVAYLQVIQRFQYFYTICYQKTVLLKQLLMEITARNEKVVVFTKFLSEIKFLKESGILRGYQYVVLSGTTNKTKALKLFETGVPIMICTYKVEMPRLFLHGCGNVIYFSQTFDYKDKLSIFPKLYADHPVKVRIYDFWVNTHLENLIRDNLSRKKKVLQNVHRMMSYKEVCDL